jgi:hypothetical protein
MSESHPLTRRSVFGLAAGGVLSAQMPVRMEPAMATDRAGSAGSLDQAGAARGPPRHVAGPRDGTLAAWARRLQAPLASGLMDGDRLDLRFGGGVDGVTAANQFDARAVPDGQNALLFSGSVALAWLAGESRVRLDPAHLLPLFAAIGPGVLMVRGRLAAPDAMPASLGQRDTGTRLRVAVGNEPDASLAALLGLDLLGIANEAVPGGADPVAAARSGVANAVFLAGAEAASRAASLTAEGFTPTLSTQMSEGSGHAALKAPFFLTGLPEARLRADPLVEAWRATAAASALCAVLVVPRLTPAAAIGRWRRAAVQGVADEAVAAQARSAVIRLVAGPDAAGALAPMQVGGATQLALRRWMAARGWRQG